MSLSTSNSSQQTNLGDWPKTWLLAGILIILCLGSWECFWRLKGYKPGLSDRAGLWAIERNKVRSLDPQQIVLIGASRIRLGVDLDIFAQAFNGKNPIQLAIDGSSFIPVLSNLAEDGSFNGIIICEAYESAFLDYHYNLDRSQEYVGFYKKFNTLKLIEQHLVMFLQKNLVYLLPGLVPRILLSSIVQHKWPEKPYVITYPDRSGKADYTKLDLEQHREYRIKRTLEEYLTIPRTNTIDTKIENEVEESIRKIQSRGGKVIIVRFPTIGPVKELDDKYLPRNKVWDLWASNTDAIMIHFEDYPFLAKFNFPDYSHLDYRDSPSFTRALATVIKENIDTENQRRP